MGCASWHACDEVPEVQVEAAACSGHFCAIMSVCLEAGFAGHVSGAGGAERSKPLGYWYERALLEMERRIRNGEAGVKRSRR